MRLTILGFLVNTILVLVFNFYFIGKQMGLYKILIDMIKKAIENKLRR